MKHKVSVAKTGLVALPAGEPAAKIIDLLYAARQGLEKEAG